MFNETIEYNEIGAEMGFNDTILWTSDLDCFDYVIDWDTGECIPYDDTLDVYPNKCFIF